LFSSVYICCFAFAEVGVVAVVEVAAEVAAVVVVVVAVADDDSPVKSQAVVS
jgi:hypothetical protein